LKIHSKLAEGLFLLEKTSITDERGLFQRIYCPEELADFWGDRKICQANRSITKEVGAFRGFHFQKPPFCEMKFIQCIHGSVYDIAIDLRLGSKTFLQSFAYELSDKNNLCVVIPEGFAHGFQVLEPNSELIYFHSAPYRKDYEDGINYLDSSFKIKLPFPVKDISMRDKNFKPISLNYEGIEI
jgi:dTDP-4-dehydrorhamnose 3,5-epimerase